MHLTRAGSISANPIEITGFSGTGGAALSWAATGVDALEVRVGATDGPFFSRRRLSGSKVTGKWVRDGITFYLQGASSGQAHRAADTLAAVALHAQAWPFAAALLGVRHDAVRADGIAAVIEQQLGSSPQLGSGNVRSSMVLVCEAYLSKSTVVFEAALDKAQSGLALEPWACERVRQLGVPSPKVLAFDTSRQYFPSPYLTVKKVSGQPLNTLQLPPHKLGPLLRQVGQCARLIHSVQLEGCGYLDEALYLVENGVRGAHETWRDAVLEHLAEAAYLQRHGLLPRNTLGALRARLEQYDDMLRHCEVGCLLHGDLGSGHNLCIRRRRGCRDHRLCTAAIGDPAWDLARIALERDRDQLQYVLDGCEPDSTMRRALTGSIALFRPLVVIAYTQWTHKRGLANGIPSAWRPSPDQGLRAEW